MSNKCPDSKIQEANNYNSAVSNHRAVSNKLPTCIFNQNLLQHMKLAFHIESLKLKVAIIFTQVPNIYNAYASILCKLI